MTRWLVLVLALAACPAPPPPTAPPPPPPPVPEPAPEPPRVEPRRDLEVGESPMSLVVHGGRMVWTDAAGAIFTMPSDGSAPPAQLSDQKSPGFAFRLFLAGDQVLATSRRDLLHVPLPGGPVRRLGVTGIADNALDALGSARFAYVTVFKRDELLRVPVAGGPAQKIGSLPRAVLGLHGDTLYAASYATGELLAIPDGGRARQVARGFVRPTGVAADATHVFVYSERQKTITRVDVATGAKTVIAEGLENSDDLLSDGAWLYAYTWGDQPALLRIAKDGSRPPQVIADRLRAPYRIAVDDEAIYVTSRDQHAIVRIAKAALPPP